MSVCLISGGQGGLSRRKSRGGHRALTARGSSLCFQSGASAFVSRIFVPENVLSAAHFFLRPRPVP